jgi:hypothetical protein
MQNGPMFAMLVMAPLSCAAAADAQGAAPSGDAANGKRVYMAVGALGPEPRRHLALSAHDTATGRSEGRRDPGSLDEVACL